MLELNKHQNGTKITTAVEYSEIQLGAVAYSQKHTEELAAMTLNSVQLKLAKVVENIQRVKIFIKNVF